MYLLTFHILQVTLCATASLVTPRGAIPGRLDVSAVVAAPRRMNCVC